MVQKNIDTSDAAEAERARETAEARARLLRLAEEQGVRPLNFDELLGTPEPDDEGEMDVDAFLRELREWRDTPSSRRLA